jgi:hypothetical protein
VKEPPLTVRKQIKDYIAAQAEPKRSEMQELHGIILALLPDCKLWFLDGKDEQGKVVLESNVDWPRTGVPVRWREDESNRIQTDGR